MFIVLLIISCMSDIVLASNIVCVCAFEFQSGMSTAVVIRLVRILYVHALKT